MPSLVNSQRSRFERTDIHSTITCYRRAATHISGLPMFVSLLLANGPFFLASSTAHNPWMHLGSQLGPFPRLPTLNRRSINALQVSISPRRIWFILGENMRQMITIQDEHIHLAKERNDLLLVIRGIQDFHDFLRPPKTSDLLTGLPPNGPTITFNICKDRCDALVLLPGSDAPLHIPLERFSLE